MTEIHEYGSIAVVGLVLILIFVALIQSISAETPQSAQEKLTPPLVLDMLNEVVEPGVFGPVKIRMQTLGASYVYEITVSPKLKLIGEHPDTEIISLLRFKGHTVRAKVVDAGGERETFTIEADKDVVDVALKGTITSDMRPIVEYSAYNDIIEEGTQVLIRNSKKGAILASVFISEKGIPYIPEIVEDLKYVCAVTFDFECKKEKQYTNPPLLGCSPEGQLSDCEKSVDLCGGTARVRIHDTRDELRQRCGEERVRAEITYENGEEWEDAGEIVFVSFWKATECTRGLTDFGRMLGCEDAIICPDSSLSCKAVPGKGKEILGGEFELHYGIIRTS